MQAEAEPANALADAHDLAADAVVWATSHGLVMGYKGDPSGTAVVHAPLSVWPVPFPRASFAKAQAAATVFNTLIDRVSRDSDYLQSTLREAAKYDDFTAKLLEVYRNTTEVREARAPHELVLAINRSDYMLDGPSNRLLQVELNTIASSFGCLSSLVSRLHAYLLPRAEHSPLDAGGLPANAALEEIPAAIAAAHEEYGDPEAVVLMVVQPGERNAFDQQWIQMGLWERHGLRTVRKTLAELSEQARLESSSASASTSSSVKQLRLGGRAVSVVYYRAGYSPNDYPTEREWEARTMLECCDAALSPSVAYQLAGAKKVQQDLAGPGVAERFVDGPEQAALVRACFAGLWSLDDPGAPETASVLQDAAAQPELFVLKPQREGGGNNLYGEQLQKRIADPSGLAAFILMQRIRPPINRSVIVREGQVAEVDSLSELGVYGTFVRRGNDVILNREAGHLVRTKTASSDEGGVAAGFAVLDSPYLMD